MRKFFVIIIIFLAIASIALLGYAYLRRTPAEETKEAEPAAVEAQKVLATGVVSAVSSFNGERVWYLSAEGKIFSVNLDTGEREEFVLPKNPENPTGALWQEKGSDLIVEQNLGGHIRYTYIDAKNKTLTEYPANIRSPVILSGDNRIAYDWVSENKHELKVSDIDSSNFTAIGDLFQPDYGLAASPRKQEIVMFGQATTSPLVHVDLEKKEFKNLAEESRYLSAKFSPDAARLLVVEDRQGLKIFWVYDFGTNQKIDLSISDAVFAIWTRDSNGIIFTSENGLKEASLKSSDIKEWRSFQAPQVKEVFLHPFKDILFYIDAESNLKALDLNDLSL